MGFDISLSPSKIGVLKDCPKCFYNANVLKVERPRGIFPSLPGGVDLVMKHCIDAGRPNLTYKLATQLPGRTLWGGKEQINKLRNWRSGLKVELKIQGKTVSLIGALDDLIVEPDGTFSPFDVKTKGKEPETDGAEYYQHQMDLYSLMLRENKMHPSGKAYLDYYFPVAFHEDNTGRMEWGDKLFELAVSPARGMEWLEKAVAIMTAGAAPASSSKCEYCAYLTAYINKEKKP